MDLLVLDIKLPGKGGLETLRAVRRHERFRHLPIVFISGALDPLVETAEADICLRKSERLASYFAMVRTIDEYGRSMKADPASRADHLERLRASLV